MLLYLDFSKIGEYHAIDLAESFLMVYLSPQTEQFSVHFGQSKVSYAICYMPFDNSHTATCGMGMPWSLIAYRAVSEHLGY